jgi:hypothetical protein
MARRKDVFRDKAPPDGDRMRSVAWQSLQVTALNFEHSDGTPKEPTELTEAERFCIREIRREQNGAIAGYTLLNRDQLMSNYLKVSAGGSGVEVNVNTSHYMFGLAAQLGDALKQDEAFVAAQRAKVIEHDTAPKLVEPMPEPSCFAKASQDLSCVALAKQDLPEEPRQPQRATLPPPVPSAPPKPPPIGQFEQHRNNYTASEMPRSNVRDEYSVSAEKYFGVDTDCWGTDRQWRDRVK